MQAHDRSLPTVVYGLASINNVTHQEEQLWLACRMSSGSN